MKKGAVGRICWLCVLSVLHCLPVGATHNRAGQIVYRHISGQTYEFTLTTFTYSPSPANVQRDFLSISWGDNTVSEIPRISIEHLPDLYDKNTYRMQHTFPGAGVYSIIMEDPNRNAGVNNIPNSVNVIFSVTTVFRIDPNLGANNAPELLTYPLDKAALGRVFVHNPSAYDSDGDSLSYEMTVCTRDRGVEIETYSLPPASDSIGVNAVTGDLVWASPTKTGIYNVAMKINEWRGGVKIGSITRDMQIEVVESDNHPPEIGPFPPLCVTAGDTIDMTVTATDPDGDRIQLTATGGPFTLGSHPATFTTVSGGAGLTNAAFVWQTDSSHVRKQPYTVTFKAEDQNTDVKLVAFANLNITVVAPEVENLTATASRKTIALQWSPSLCTHAAGYEIYRSIGSDSVATDSCFGGIPDSSSFELIATSDIPSYTDDNGGRGLSPGIDYCYRVVTYFSDGARSFPSEEACATLLPGLPPMIRAHVADVSTSGIVEVAWLREPLETTLAGKAGPFQFRLFYAESSVGPWTLLKSTTPDMQLDDTTFTHTVNTLDKYRHFYKVELWNMEAGAESLMDDNTETASTLYPALSPSDRSVIIRFDRYTPWVNTEYTVYRCDGSSGVCVATDSVGATSRESYTDTGLINGQQYCYRVRSRGYRRIEGIEYRTENWSHVACIAPYDNVPPCIGELKVESICEENQNTLNWAFDPVCMDDVQKYRIHYAADRSQPLEVIDSVMSQNVLAYTHKNVSVGCYAVSAIDENDNESLLSNTVCVDECGNYDLPNVFSPNGDGINDVFKSSNIIVGKVDMKIYNRWGKLVFKTDDPAINWDGRDVDSKRFVPSGVYYYVCDLYEERITGARTKTLTGFIHVYVGDDAKPYEK